MVRRCHDRVHQEIAGEALGRHRFLRSPLAAREPGKRDFLKLRVYYWLSTFLSCLTLGLVNVSPGLIAIARKRHVDAAVDVRPVERPLRKAA